jgi:UDP-N-acetylmuramate dehydrogenase
MLYQMDIQFDADLAPYNTFGIKARAKALGHFSKAEEAQELLEYSKEKNLDPLIIGGGSNLLFTRNHPGLILVNDIPGIDVVDENGHEVVVRAGAGVQWHDLVLYCVHHEFGGIENMSLIPGKVGAAPMQNIGAYGVELKDVFVQLHALNRETGEVITFDNTSCEFGYRESFFKRRGKDKFIILSVDIRLTKRASVNISYGSIAQELEASGISAPSIKDVSDAVIKIRRSKLPDPARIGNAGSFFKNPVVSNYQYQDIKAEYPDAVGYPVDGATTKLAAGWMIEKAGWKGYRANDHGVHDRQALVLVNHGNAKGLDLYNLSQRIMDSVLERFGVELEREVNIY